MDSFEFNKVAMSVLGAVFILMSLNFLSEGLFHSDKPEQPGYAIEVAAVSGDAEGGEDTGPAYEPINALLASADIGAGEKAAKKCAACHSFDEGGANKVGPALYGVVNRAIASVDGFGYSGSLKEYSADKSWTYEELNGFLWKPKTYVKGTSMGFAGLKKVDDRAAVIAYLRSLAGTPAPLPDATEASAEPEAAEEETTSETSEETPAPEASEDAATEESETDAATQEQPQAETEETPSDAQPEAETTEEPAEEETSTEGNDNSQAQ